MKECDKLFCIKDLFITEYYYSAELDQQFINLVEANFLIAAEKEAKWKAYVDEKEKLAYQSQFLTCGKVYEIKSTLGNQVRITGDNGDSRFFLLDTGYDVYDDYPNKEKLNDYLVSIQEARRRKLEQLNDENFSSFLKKIKKKSK